MMLSMRKESKISDSVNFLNRYLQDLMINRRKHDNLNWKQHMATTCLLVAACHVWLLPLLQYRADQNHGNLMRMWVKINGDATYSYQDVKSYVSSIARDHNGKVLWASSRETGRGTNDEDTEAKAYLIALHQIPIPKNLFLVLESDNATVVDAIKKRNQKLSSMWGTTTKLGFLKVLLVVSKLANL
jgi:hypothetical protein